MKLIHAADIHLDSPMRGLARYDGAPVEQLRLATRGALANLVDLALEEGAAALLIAGDLFDGDWLDHGTGAHFVREMTRLRDAGIHVVTIAGNHDAASRMTKAIRMPTNVRALPVAEPGTAVYQDLGLAVHGQGFATAAVHEDLSAAYPAALAGYFNVGLLHTSADGRPGHEPYAPCRPERLSEKGYDYWGLGHVHGREILIADPPVVFAGCLQGRHVRETGPKGATVLHVDADGGVTLEERVLDVVRWAVCEVNTAGAEDQDEVHARVAAALRETCATADGRLLAVRVRIFGATAAHAALVRSRDRVHHEVVLAAEDVAQGEVWIEDVQLRTSAPTGIDTAGDDAYAELVRTVRLMPSSDATLARLVDDLQPLAGKLPGALLSVFDPTDPGVVRELLTEVERTLPVRLLLEQEA